MKFFQGIKKITKPFVDVGSWMGYSQLSDSTKKLYNGIKILFIPQPKPANTENFDEAVKRLGLTEEVVQQRKKEFLRLCLVYAVIGVLVLAYAIYLAWLRSPHGAIAGFAVSLLSFTQAFRYHFWWFQLREQRLGCTFREWLDSGLVGKK